MWGTFKTFLNLTKKRPWLGIGLALIALIGFALAIRSGAFSKTAATSTTVINRTSGAGKTMTGSQRIDGAGIQSQGDGNVNVFTNKGTINNNPK